MATTTPLDLEIRSRLSAVLAGEMPLREFYRWFVPATLDVEYTGNPEAIRLTHDLAHFFSELSAGILTRDEIRQMLASAASPSSGINNGSPFQVLVGSEERKRGSNGEIKSAPGWRDFEEYARRYFSELWGVELQPRNVTIEGTVPWKFDLVSPDFRYVGDAKWLKNIKVPAAKWQAIAEYVWLLQKIPAEKTFIVFGQDAEVAERFLKRVRALTEPVEFYFLDESGHRRL
jgi:hypothetical protein